MVKCFTVDKNGIGVLAATSFDEAGGGGDVRGRKPEAFVVVVFGAVAPSEFQIHTGTRLRVPRVMHYKMCRTKSQTFRSPLYVRYERVQLLHAWTVQHRRHSILMTIFTYLVFRFCRVVFAPSRYVSYRVLLIQLFTSVKYLPRVVQQTVWLDTSLGDVSDTIGTKKPHTFELWTKTRLYHFIILSYNIIFVCR